MMTQNLVLRTESAAAVVKEKENVIHRTESAAAAAVVTTAKQNLLKSKPVESGS